MKKNLLLFLLISLFCIDNSAFCMKRKRNNDDAGRQQKRCKSAQDDDAFYEQYAQYVCPKCQRSCGGNVEVFAGRPRFPDMRVTVNASYDWNDRLNLFSQVRYRDETKAFLGAHDYSDSLNTLDSVFYLDLRAGYQFSDSLAAYVGINNVLDEEPDILIRGASGGTNTDTSVYDVIGRQIFAGFRYSMN